MISVSDAFSILQKNIPNAKHAEYQLQQALSHILAEDVFSTINMPPFRQSAMDGYALCLLDGLEYKIVGEIKAGDAHRIDLQPGQALKIFTGAAVPDSAQAVIPIEKVNTINDKLFLEEPIQPQTNVRPIGEQISIGELALKKGTFLNAAAIGFLAGLGFTTAKVYKKPTVGIVITGNELTQAGEALTHGKVYESNGIMLESALKESHFESVTKYEVNDDFENTKSKLSEALESNDILLVSGGISVGDYDFVSQALKELEVETLFYKVNQKPGKPLFSGKHNEKLIFALPGNPAAALTCFYVYVLPSLEILSGKNTTYTPTKYLPIAHDYSVKNSRSQFLKANITNNEVAILSHQASSMLNSFAVSNGIVFANEGEYEFKKGDQVPVYILD